MYLQLFVNVLVPFPTRTLLPLALVSHRFHDIISHILHCRLLAAAAPQDRKLILECFHPSDKLTAPSLLCEYIGTDDVVDEVKGEKYLSKDVGGAGRLGRLAGLYSHFRPVGPDVERLPRRPRRRQPAGDVSGYPNSSTIYPASSPSCGSEIPSQIVSLEPHELFSQLCTVVNLVKAVPDAGFLLSCVTIGEGVIRIWRDWLVEHAVLPRSKENSSPEVSSRSILAKTVALQDRERILWIGNACNIGIKLRVINRDDLGIPVLMRIDEDAYVVYNIEYEG